MYICIYLYICGCIYVYINIGAWIYLRCHVECVVVLLYSHVPYHNDTIIKQTHEDFLNKIYTSPFIARVRKGLCRVLL